MHWTSKARVAALGLALVSTGAGAADSPFKFYGFVLPYFSVTSGAVETFSQQNEGAVTAAANPAIAGANVGSARSTFQVAQSRFGFTVDPTADIQARIEMDFIDFSKASPTTAAVPRLRRATVAWNAAPGL